MRSFVHIRLIEYEVKREVFRAVDRNVESKRDFDSIVLPDNFSVSAYYRSTSAVRQICIYGECDVLGLCNRFALFYHTAYDIQKLYNVEIVRGGNFGHNVTVVALDARAYA